MNGDPKDSTEELTQYNSSIDQEMEYNSAIVNGEDNKHPKKTKRQSIFENSYMQKLFMLLTCKGFMNFKQKRFFLI